MKEYVENIKKYVENVESMREYIGKIEKYIENLEEIYRYIGFRTAHIGSGTWKNSDLFPFMKAQELRKILCFTLGSGTWKNPELSPSIWSAGT